MLGAVILIIALISIKVNIAIKQRQERRNFAQLEQTLTSFSAQVEQALGKPLQQETKSFCDRTGVKFGKGALFCGTRTGANYATDSVSEARLLSEKVKQVASLQSNFTNITQKYSTERSDYWSNNMYLLISPTFDCSLDFVYGGTTQQISGFYIGDSKPGTFGYLLRCTEYSSQQYYPTGQ